MSFESPGLATLAVDPRPPLPGPRARSRVSIALSRAIGLAILALSALFVVSLLTWSVGDPSLANVTSQKPRNGLGPIGAIVSDLVIQTLGLASVFALLPPVFWAAQFLTRDGVERLRTKLVLAPLAVLCLAAFLSVLPKASAWPLKAGYGGLLGDLGAAALSGFMATVSTDAAGLLAGLALSTAGFTLLMIALGLTPSDLKRMAERKPREYKPNSSWVQTHLNKIAPAGFEADLTAPATALAPAEVAPVRVAAAPAAASAAAPAPLVPPVMPAAARETASVPDAPLTPAWIPEMQPTAARAAAPASPAAATVSLSPAPVPETAVRSARDTIPGAAIITAAADVSASVPPPPVAPRAVPLGPDAAALPRSSSPRIKPVDLDAAERVRRRKLSALLETFRVHGTVSDHASGPVVTTFTVDLAAGVRPQRIAGLAQDFARGLGVDAVRVKVMAGRGVMHLEAPHDDRITLGLGDLVTDPAFVAAERQLPIALGATASGDACIADLADAPHVLVAGRDARDRAGLLQAILVSLLSARPGVRLLGIDVGASALAAARMAVQWEAPIAIDAKRAGELLTWAAAEIEARGLRMRSLAQSRTIDDYNARAETLASVERLPHLVVVIADLAVLAGALEPAATAALETVLRQGRAAGLHIVAATSSVGPERLPASLLSAFPTRLALALASMADSRAVLGDTGAEDLLDGGDMLVVSASEHLQRSLGRGDVHRVHAALLDDMVVRQAFARHEQASASPAQTRAAVPPSALPQPRMSTPIAHTPPSATVPTAPTTAAPSTASRRPAPGVPTDDDLYDRAVSLVRRERAADPVLIERRLGVGYVTAMLLLEQMARDRIVSDADDDGHRKVLIGRAA